MDAFVTQEDGGLLAVLVAGGAGLLILRATPGVAPVGVARSLDGALWGLLAKAPSSLGRGVGAGAGGVPAAGGDRLVVVLVDRDWDVGGAALHGNKLPRVCSGRGRLGRL